MSSGYICEVQAEGGDKERNANYRVISLELYSLTNAPSRSVTVEDNSGLKNISIQLNPGRLGFLTRSIAMRTALPQLSLSLELQSFATTMRFFSPAFSRCQQPLFMEKFAAAKPEQQKLPYLWLAPKTPTSSATLPMHAPTGLLV